MGPHSNIYPLSSHQILSAVLTHRYINILFSLTLQGVTNYPERMYLTTGYRTELVALQTTEGTFPADSMWRANPLFPPTEEGGSWDYGDGHVIDNVKVPDDL